jgi:hypothetical protein
MYAAGYRSNSPFFNSQESLQVPINGLDRLDNGSYCLLPRLLCCRYDALQVKLNRRFANGFQMNLSYAWGKSIDYSGYDELGYVNYKGLTKFNRQNIFTYSAIYELPFGAGKKGANNGIQKAVLGGWQLNGLWTWESGLPLFFDPTKTPSTNLNATGNQQWPEVIAP